MEKFSVKNKLEENESKSGLNELFAALGCADLESFYKKYQPSILKKFTNLAINAGLHNPQVIAEDLTSDFFVKKLTIEKVKFDKEKMVDEHGAEAFVHRIARNYFIDYIRKYNITEKKGFSTEEEGVPEPRSCKLNPLEELELKQDKQILTQSFNILPNKMRAILKARFIEDLDYVEIAEKLGIPLGTVKNNINRGKLLLRKRIKNPALIKKIILTKENPISQPKDIKKTLSNKLTSKNTIIKNNFQQDSISLKVNKENIEKEEETHLSPASMLSINPEEFKRIRNNLSEQQNLALQLIYEKKIYNDIEKLAEILDCEPEEVGHIAKLARENFERIQKNESLLKS